MSLLLPVLALFVVTLPSLLGRRKPARVRVDETWTPAGMTWLLSAPRAISLPMLRERLLRLAADESPDSSRDAFRLQELAGEANRENSLNRQFEGALLGVHFTIWHCPGRHAELEEECAKAGTPDVESAVRAHRAWLSVEISGMPDDKPSTVPWVERLHCRIMLALHEVDCLLLFMPEHRVLEPSSPALLAHLRSAQPQSILQFGREVYFSTSDSDDMQAAVRQAKLRFPEFLQAWREKGAATCSGFRCKAEFSSAGDREFLWFQVEGVDPDGHVMGIILNLASYTGMPTCGDEVRVRFDQIRDWAFERDGVVVGDFTCGVLERESAQMDSQQPPSDGSTSSPSSPPAH